MNLFRLNLSLAVTTLVFIGCGSNTPFSRGKDSLAGLEKIQGNPTTNTPTPTPSPASEDLCEKVPNSTKMVCESEFNRYIIGALQDSCVDCHDNKTPDFKTALTLIELGNPQKSILFKMATGQGNITSTKKHKAIWKPGDQSYKNLEEWISGK